MDKKEYMLSQVDTWRGSGLTQQSYCNQVGIKLATFNYWVQKSKNQENLSGFIEIKKPTAILENKYEVLYPNGVVVRLETNNLKELSALVNLY
ncbi:IS66 family insertion sequence element accessory protein TnpB [Gelidibacter sp. F2691]|nr:IS66 family insertion sequence element accessory protein TnpB [Gelidibacter sp. F2691]MCK0125291.1 IS66 family insertion sequence element accessory protein TnpB [Gelidibacter sp. F2691]MCK0126871.1 IS66 family insertion sequence element accessory protein TnpB [Gelidibacter sp. F2691]